jgi:hypothetical protein
MAVRLHKRNSVTALWSSQINKTVFQIYTSSHPQSVEREREEEEEEGGVNRSSLEAISFGDRQASANEGGRQIDSH